MLSIPFALQVLPLVVTVGYLSHRNSQATVADLTNQMSKDLQESQQQLENHSTFLEASVSQRTQELQIEVERRGQAETALKRVNAELHRLAFMDGLTQIANRRSFDERLEHEWQRLKRDQLPLALILLDVDYFKRFNGRNRFICSDIAV
jgi:PleD family two-component response regulator